MRVQPLAAPLHLIVQVRAGGAPGGAQQAHGVARLQGLAQLHVHPRQVRVHGAVAKAMADGDGIAVAALTPGLRDLAARGGMNGLARGAFEIQPAVRFVAAPGEGVGSAAELRAERAVVRQPQRHRLQGLQQVARIACKATGERHGPRDGHQRAAGSGVGLAGGGCRRHGLDVDAAGAEVGLQLADHLLGFFQRAQLGIDLGRGEVAQIVHLRTQAGDFLAAGFQFAAAFGARNDVMGAHGGQAKRQQHGGAGQADQRGLEPTQRPGIDLQRAGFGVGDDQYRAAGHRDAGRAWRSATGCIGPAGACCAASARARRKARSVKPNGFAAICVEA